MAISEQEESRAAPVEAGAARGEERRGGLVWRVLRDVGPPWLVTRLLLLAITLLYAAPHAQWAPWQQPFLAAVLPDPPASYSPSPPVSDPLINRWYRWDAAWYMRIAGNGPSMGYSHFTENSAHDYGAFAFFPLYPLAVRAAALLVPGALAPVPAATPPPSLVVAGLVVANVAFVLALVALYLLVQARAGPGAGRRTAWLLCLFPTTIFFSAPYSESLFLLWLVLFFLALDRRHWWLAGLCGALAAATRSFGALLVLPYLVAWAQETFSPRRRGDTEEVPSLPRRHGGAAGAEDTRRRIDVLSLSPFDRRSKGARVGRDTNSSVDSSQTLRVPLRVSVSPWLTLLPVVIIPLGMAAYMLYQWVGFGDPLLFQEAQKAWSRMLAPPWVGLFYGFAWPLSAWPHLAQPQWRGLVDASYAAVFLLLTALAWRGMSWPGRAYAVVFWLYVLCDPLMVNALYSDTLISMPRFLLVLLPVWTWLGRSRARTWLVAVPSAILLAGYAVRWVNGGWIG